MKVNVSILVLAMVTTALVIVVLLCVFYGRKILDFFKRKASGRRAGDLDFSNVDAILTDERKPLHSIPYIANVIGRVIEEKKVGIPDLINYLIAESHNLGASDLHFTPLREKGMMISMRIEGTLYDLTELPIGIISSLMRRIKVMASLDVYKKETPQDGRINVGREKRLDIRVSFVPTVNGEKCVMRFYTTPMQLLNLENLGFSKETLQKYRELAFRPQGAIYLTGPTGSGKTITAYATLNAIKEKKGGKVNIVTIEDPVEFKLPFLNQTQVNEKIGLTFSVGLRSLLRQDPNVILIGEIRDRETAEIAIQAGLTGHLIISSVHAESTAGVFARLINMGIEPFILASASSGVLAQRLVRKLCPFCRREVNPTTAQLKQLESFGIVPDSNERKFMIAEGCKKCLGVGVSGRMAIFELLVVDDEIRELVVSKASAQAIYSRCIEKGMRSLAEEGVEKARQGLVSLDEVLAIVAG